MKRVARVTPKQEALLPQWRDEWIRIGLSCEPADWPAADEAVRGLYRAASLEPPRGIVHVPSPMVGALAAPIAANLIALARKRPVRSAVGSAVRSAVGSAVDSAVDSAVGSAVDSAVRSAVRSAVDSAVDSAVGSAVDSAVRSAVRSAVDSAVDSAVGKLWWHYWFGGHLWCYYTSWFSSLAHIAPACRTAAGDAYEALSRSAGYAWLNRDFAMVSDRPRHLARDDRGRLHDETRMAIEWRDGWGLWIWHGVRVPASVITAPDSISIEEIKREKDAEVRRVMRERFGEGRYLRETGVQLVHADYETVRKGAAPRALLQDDEGRRFLVGTDGSTGRVYHMEVAPEIDNCRTAHESLCGFPEERIRAKS